MDRPIPSENILEGLKVKRVMDICLLDSEDIRHLVKTMAALRTWNSASRLQTINFHLLNEKADITARICLLMELVLTLDFTKTDDLLFLWCVWYNMELSVEHHARLLDVLHRLVRTVKTSSKNRKWKLGNEIAEIGCSKTWQTWIDKKQNLKKCRKGRETWISVSTGDFLEQHEPGRDMHNDAGQDGDVWTSDMSTEAVTWAKAVNDLENLPSYGKQVWDWLVTGSVYPSQWARSQQEKTRINPTMMRPESEEWPTSPFSAFLIEGPKLCDSQPAMVDACAAIFAKQVKECQRNAKAVQVSVVFWLGSYLTILGPTDEALPGALTFDVVHTNLLAYRRGLMQVILWCGPRLKDTSSVLVTSIISRKSLSTQPNKAAVDLCGIVEEELGCEVNLLPTLYGIHLAEDPGFGVTVPPQSPLSAILADRVRWTKSSLNQKGKLCLAESSDIREALKRIMQACFVDYDVNEKESNFQTDEGPLAALTILMRLELFAKEGMSELLSISAQGRPQGLSRQDPFYMCVRTLLGRYGYVHIADVEEDDEVLCIEVPDQLQQLAQGSGKADRGHALTRILLVEVHPTELTRTDGNPDEFRMDTSSRHLFTNISHQADLGIVRWEMLKSDWDRLSPATALFLLGSSKVLDLKKVATIKQTWPIGKRPDASQGSIGGENKDVQIIGIAESLDVYLVRLLVPGSRVKPKACHLAGEERRTRTNKLHLKVEGKYWEGLDTVKLSFSCNINAEGVEISGERNEVTVKVPKHTLWNSGALLLPTADFKVRSAFRINSEVVRAKLEGLTNKVFWEPIRERDVTVLETESRSFRNHVVSIWEAFCRQPLGSVVTLFSNSEQPEMELAFQGFYKYDGLFVIRVGYIDLAAARVLLKLNSITLEELQQYIAQATDASLLDWTVVPDKKKSCVKLKGERQDIKLLSSLLYRNALRVPQDQPCPTWIVQSFIQLYYPRFVRTASDFLAEMNMGKKSGPNVEEKKKSKEASLVRDQTQCAVCGKLQQTHKCKLCMEIYYCFCTCQETDRSSDKKTRDSVVQVESCRTRSTETTTPSERNARSQKEPLQTGNVSPSESVHGAMPDDQKAKDGRSEEAAGEESDVERRRKDKTLMEVKDGTRSKEAKTDLSETDRSSDKKTRDSVVQVESCRTRSTETTTPSERNARSQKEPLQTGDVSPSESSRRQGSGKQEETQKAGLKKGSITLQNLSYAEEKNLPDAKDTRSKATGEVSPAISGSPARFSEDLYECKICHKEQSDLEARIIYYCGDDCFEKDRSKSYPVDILASRKTEGEQKQA